MIAKFQCYGSCPLRKNVHTFIPQDLHLPLWGQSPFEASDGSQESHGQPGPNDIQSYPLTIKEAPDPEGKSTSSPRLRTRIDFCYCYVMGYVCKAGYLECDSLDFWTVFSTGQWEVSLTSLSTCPWSPACRYYGVDIADNAAATAMQAHPLRCAALSVR
jgi:hypothetical protein